MVKRNHQKTMRSQLTAKIGVIKGAVKYFMGENDGNERLNLCFFCRVTFTLFSRYELWG